MIKFRTARCTFQLLEAAMDTLRSNDRYKVLKKNFTAQDWIMAHGVRRETEADAFLMLASVCKIPLEVIHLSPGQDASLPVSEFGLTTIQYVGATPTVSLATDQYGNTLICLEKGCVVEVIFNRSFPNAHGRNKRAQAKKIIYVA